MLGFATLRLKFGTLGNDLSAKRQELSSLEAQAASAKQFTTQYTSLQEVSNSKSHRYDLLADRLAEDFGKYQPLLVIDAIQAIKPEGVWFDDFKIERFGEDLEINASAKSGLLVAEFITKLKATYDSVAEKDDYLSQVKFRNISIGTVEKKGVHPDLPDIENYYSFPISFQMNRNTNFSSPTSSVFWPQSRIYRF